MVSRRAERPPERQRACQTAISRRGRLFGLGGARGLGGLPEALAGFPGVGFLAASIGPQYHSPPAVFLTSKSVPTTASEP